jgi:hypothetical protein
MTADEDHAGSGPASNIGGGQLIGRSWSRSTDLGRTLHAASRRGKSGLWDHPTPLTSFCHRNLSQLRPVWRLPVSRDSRMFRDC